MGLLIAAIVLLAVTGHGRAAGSCVGLAVFLAICMPQTWAIIAGLFALAPKDDA